MMVYKTVNSMVVAPFLISQCYNIDPDQYEKIIVVAPFLISQCYNDFCFDVLF